MTQQLVMTPQLQQAIKLLQLTRLELQDVVRQELEENPLLEESIEVEEVHEPEPLEIAEKESEPEQGVEEFHEVETGEDTLRDWDSYLDGYNYSSGEQYSGEDERPSFESMLTRKGTLIDHLLWQLHMGRFSHDEVLIGEEIIGNIDENGYLRASVEEIAQACKFDSEKVLPVLEHIKEFDPTGVGARDLRECLLIQARFMGNRIGLPSHRTPYNRHCSQLDGKAGGLFEAVFCSYLGEVQSYPSATADQIRHLGHWRYCAA